VVQAWWRVQVCGGVVCAAGAHLPCSPARAAVWQRGAQCARRTAPRVPPQPPARVRRHGVRRSAASAGKGRCGSGSEFTHVMWRITDSVPRGVVLQSPRCGNDRLVCCRYRCSRNVSIFLYARGEYFLFISLMPFFLRCARNMFLICTAVSMPLISSLIVDAIFFFVVSR